MNQFKDGGIAIIDQILCAHSRYFIGTYESTFSFRIQEEREILGFNYSTTFNRFCFETNKNECQTTRWLIKKEWLLHYILKTLNVVYFVINLYKLNLRFLYRGITLP